MKQTLFSLLNTYGGTGREDAIRETIAEMARPYCDEMRTDALGNLICIRRAAGEGGRRIMVSAHMDHIGFVVLDADKHGFLRVHNAGGISKRASINRHVIFANGVNGVVSNETESFSADDGKMSNLFIDIGAKDREDALSMVSLGDVAVYVPDAFELANGMVAAPAMDDRVGCAIALEARRSLSSLPCRRNWGCAARARPPTPSIRKSAWRWTSPSAATPPRARRLRSRPGRAPASRCGTVPSSARPAW